MTTEQLADFQTLAEELDEECARELAASFLEDSITELSGVDSGITAKDSDKVRMHAHGLKGCCRTIKAPRGEEVASDLEFAAIEKDWSKVESLRNRFQQEYEMLAEFVQEYLRR